MWSSSTPAKGGVTVANRLGEDRVPARERAHRHGAGDDLLTTERMTRKEEGS